MGFSRNGYSRQDIGLSEGEPFTIVSIEIPFHEDGVSLFELDAETPLGTYNASNAVAIPARFNVTAGKVDILEPVLGAEGAIPGGADIFMNVTLAASSSSMGGGSMSPATGVNCEAQADLFAYMYSEAGTDGFNILCGYNPGGGVFNPISGRIKVTLYGAIMPDVSSLFTPPVIVTE
jgi:hypothetical protein